ncbi:RrF2 family transcriptional regulator [soil metagenome]
MLNQSADHALRAVLFMAQQQGAGSCNADLIAGAIGVPRNYLGKVLHTLAQAGVLSSCRGPRGGFRLAVDPEVLTLATVVEPFQRMPERRTCLLGRGQCDPAAPCDSHRQWQGVAGQVTAFFNSTTIARMLNGGGSAPVTDVSAAEHEAPAAGYPPTTRSSL